MAKMNITNKINLDDLMDALDVKSEGVDYYCDSQTGEILSVSDDNDPIDFRERIELNLSGRYIKIEPLELSHLFKMIKDFIKTSNNKNFIETVNKMVIQPKKILAFNPILIDFHSERESWLSFKWTVLKKEALLWIKNNIK